MALILVVEDEPDMAMGLQDNLQFEGYEVIQANDGEEGLRRCLEDHPDLLLLDVMLPKIDGFEVCKRVREAGKSIPILMLTARGQEIDVVRGLELGADDYITKPFAVRELLARIKAALRRREVGLGGQRIIQIGAARVDLSKGSVSQNDTVFSLGHYESEILRMLVERSEHPVPRGELLDAIWGGDAFPTDRSVDNHIVSLRRKIEADPKHPQHILTVHGIGYKYAP
jgi:DNA-binding response OmpR family regulator